MSDANTSEEQNVSVVPTEQENITYQTNAVKTKIEQRTGIVSKVDVGAVLIELPEDWNYNETVIIDSEKLNNSAKEGYINLTLNNEDIEIIIQKSSERNDGIWYKGFTKESPDYNVDIIIRGDEVYGSIDTYDKGYTIFPTNIVVDGEIIHVITISDILNSRLELKKYPVDPLTFDIINEDNIEHNFVVEVFDPYNKSIFKESYSLQPGETINSPEISEQLGLHHYVYSLDNGESFVHYVRVERAANMGSSEKVSFEITSDAANTLLVSTTIA